MDLVPDISEWLMGNSAALGALSAAIAIVGGIGAWLTRASWLLVDRPRIYPVTNPRDRRIKAIEALQAYFPAHERDPPGLLAQKIRESRYTVFGMARSEFPVVCLCYQRRRKVMLFLTCQYHIPTGTIFFWYLLGRKAAERALGLAEETGVELARDDDDESAIALIRQMLVICDRQGGRDSRWRQVIAEVDSNNLHTARGKMRLFQTYARRLSNNPQPHVFKVEAPFLMPVHDADMLDQRQEHETPGWFVLAPREPKAYRRQDGAYYIARDELGKLYGVLEQSYASDGDLAYSAYLAEFFAKMAGGAPGLAHLEHVRHMMR